MAGAFRPVLLVMAALGAVVALAGCDGGRSVAAPPTVQMSASTVDAWRETWEPYAARFWDAVDAWHASEGSPSDLPPGGLSAVAGAAAPSIVAAAGAWAQALPGKDLPGDVNARATDLSGLLAGAADTWTRVGACGGDPACVTPLVAEARLQLYDVRSAEFALRPR